jgi:hypothetical protein
LAGNWCDSACMRSMALACVEGRCPSVGKGAGQVVLMMVISSLIYGLLS